jgi:hypothetical protein
MPGRSCVFCGRRPVTKEHVFPAWLGEYLGTLHEQQYDASRLNRGEILSEWTTPAPNVKVRRFCARECNNGWMSALEAEAQPILIRMLENPPHAIILSPEEQDTLRRWAYKTALTADLAICPSRSELIPDSTFAEFYQSRSVPPDTLVWIAAHTSRRPPYRIFSAKRATRTYGNTESKEPDGREFNTFRFVTTLLVFRIIFQVFGHLRHDHLPGDLLKRAVDRRLKGFGRITPPHGASLVWPVDSAQFATDTLTILHKRQPV